MDHLNIIDIIVAVILLVSAFFAAKKGLFKVLTNCAAYVIAVFVSRMAATPLANFIYSSFCHDKISGYLTGIIPSGQTVSLTLADILPEKVNKITEFLGLFTDGNALASLNSALSVENIENKFVMPIVSKIIMIVTTVVLFIVLSLILRIVSNWINSVMFKGKNNPAAVLNRGLGFVFGLVRAALPAAIVCEALNLIAPLLSSTTLSELVSGSYVCGFIGGLIK